jgi:hypothetical protein
MFYVHILNSFAAMTLPGCTVFDIGEWRDLGRAAQSV